MDEPKICKMWPSRVPKEFSPKAGVAELVLQRPRAQDTPRWCQMGASPRRTQGWAPGRLQGAGEGLGRGWGGQV